ncbi:hypothetical protein [Brevibacterium aurantiacum]|uniref:hypothetical protein n=1 Tax=Brevibacterium aurantiacum TaxID=273384 RepID=UPI003F8F7CAA
MVRYPLLLWFDVEMSIDASGVVEHADLAVVASTVIPVLFIGTIVATPAHVFRLEPEETLLQKMMLFWSVLIAALLFIGLFVAAIIAMTKSVFGLAGDGLSDAEAAFVSTAVIALFVTDILLAVISVTLSGFRRPRH